MAESSSPGNANADTRRVIHDLRQPLAALQMWIELLGEALDGQLGEKETRYLAKIRVEVARIGAVLSSSASAAAAAAGSGGRAGGDAAPRASSAATPDAGLLAGLSLLLVEDDEMTSEAMQLALEGEGATVAVAATIADGLRLFDEAKPQAVLSDLRVADGDGFALMTEIRRRDATRGRKTAAVAVTGYDSADTRAAARAAGFDETMTKPFELSHLVDTVLRLTAALR